MKKTSTIAITLAITILMSFQACKSDKSTTIDTNTKQPETQSVSTKQALIEPSFEGFDVQFKEFKVQTAKASKLEIKSGTNILVPPNAFTDANGNIIEGEVTLLYREFHNAADIIASGIPMSNQEGDKYMETAGMFEMRGSYNNEPINIAKDITVEMASFVDGGFDFFKLDETGGNWATLTEGTESQKAKVNIDKTKALANISKNTVKPKMPEKHNEEDFVFDFDVNYDQFPELRAFHGVIWEYEEETNEKQNEWIFEEDWDSAEISSNKKNKPSYQLSLKNDNKSFRTNVKPVLRGKDYDKAVQKFNKLNEKYQNKLKEVKVEKERAEQEADLIRGFSVSSFGVYNWDVWKNPERLLVDASFDFGDLVTELNQNKIKVFLVTESSRSVVVFNPADFPIFSYNPNEENKIIAVLPNDKIATFTNEDFKLVPKRNNIKYTFNMKVNEEIIASVDELNTAIN